MPLYEYECAACGQRFEVIQKFSDAPLSSCNLCGKGPVEKLISSPAIQFKGEGWYVTDYARKDKGGDAKKDGSQEASGKKATEAKAESSGESKSTTTPASTNKTGGSSKSTAASKD